MAEIPAKNGIANFPKYENLFWKESRPIELRKHKKKQLNKFENQKKIRKFTERDKKLKV